MAPPPAAKLLIQKETALATAGTQGPSLEGHTPMMQQCFLSLA